MAHQALAEFYFMSGYTRLAIEHLSMALKQPGVSQKQQQSFQARITELKEVALAEKQL